MIAAICDSYGAPEVVQLREFPTPTPKESEVLIRVRATTVNSGDRRVRALDLPRGFGPLGRIALGLRRPRQPILGTEVAGDIAAIGANVTRFAIGEQVFALPGARMGGHAQYLRIHELGALTRMPPNLGYDEAAALSFGGTTALDFFRRAALKAGDRVLINGASGTVGTAAIQIAKVQGAHVTAVCSGANVALVSALGADRVIDYTRTDFAATGDRYDVIFDAVGNVNIKRAKPALFDGGRLLLLAATLAELLMWPWTAVTEHRIKVIAGPAAERADDLVTLANLAKEGRYRPVIDRAFPFAQIANAHRYVDLGRKRGSVVVNVS